MRTTPQEKIDEFTKAGWWGTENFNDMFAANVATRPEALAVTDPPNRGALVGGEPTRLTYQQLDERADRLATRLAGAGLAPGDVAVVQLPNIVEQLVVYLALFRLGIVVSPVPVQYGAFELTKIAGEVRPTAYVTTAEFSGKAFAHARRSAFGSEVRCVVLGGGAEGLDLADREPTPADHAARERLGEIVVDANDIVTICWTSGTTGMPKGVPRSHNQWISTGSLIRQVVGVTDGDAVLTPFPFVNMASFGGLLVPWLLVGGRLDLHHPFDLEVFLTQLGQGVAYTSVPPAVLIRLLEQPVRVDLSALRTIASGSAPLAPSMVRGWQERYGIAVCNMFGSNEGVSLVATLADVPDPSLRARYFPRWGVPRFQWTTDVASQIRTRLVDEVSGEQIQSQGQAGELQIWGPTVFDGYLGDAPDNPDVFAEDGFFRTGDLFEIPVDDERFYEFVGRTKDIIVRGGMKISPTELDTLLTGHPGISAASVAGYPDHELGEKVGLVAVAAEGTELTLDAVTSWLREQNVAVFKLPQRLVLVDALPVNPLGKVVRGEVANILRD